jgi:hypothetical protein
MSVDPTVFRSLNAKQPERRSRCENAKRRSPAFHPIYSPDCANWGSTTPRPNFLMLFCNHEELTGILQSLFMKTFVVQGAVKISLHIATR